jgi:hypothetical protein
MAAESDVDVDLATLHRLSNDLLLSQLDSSADGSDDGTVFVAIVATAQDAAARAAETVVDLFVKALHPRRLHVGVCLSTASGNLRAECLARARALADADAVVHDCVLHNVTVVREPCQNEWDGGWRGLSYARALLEQRAYRNETYYLATSHATLFVNGWDALAIARLRACPSPSAILTAVTCQATSPLKHRTLVPRRPSLLPANAALFQVCSRTTTTAADDTLALLMRRAGQLETADAVKVDRELGTRLGTVTFVADRPRFVRLHSAAAPLGPDAMRFRTAALPPFVDDACRLGILNHLLSLHVVGQPCAWQPRRLTQAPWWSSGFAFTYGRVLRDVLHDPFYVHLPQTLYECLMTARYQAAGWSFYLPQDVLAYQDAPDAPFAGGVLAATTSSPLTPYQTELAQKSLDRLLVALGVSDDALFADSCERLASYGIADDGRRRAFLADLGLGLRARPPLALAPPTTLAGRLQRAQPVTVGDGAGADRIDASPSASRQALCSRGCQDRVEIRQTSRTLYGGVLADRDVACKYGTQAAFDQAMNAYPLPPGT